MSNNYDSNSCNALEKPFYYPIEAALRWCGLIAHEAAILNTTVGAIIPDASQFPQWPCLRVNAEKIYFAMQNGDLRCGRDGKIVDDHVAPARRTVTHTDLKEWMARCYPDQKPKFLFSEIEAAAHQAITKDTYLALKAERDKLEKELNQIKTQLSQVVQTKDSLETENQHLKTMIDGLATPKNTNIQDTNLIIIGAMIESVKEAKKKQGTSPAGVQQKFIDYITETYPNTPGLSKSQLEKKFSEANKYLKQVIE